MPKGSNLRTHGKTGTPEHGTWKRINGRCYNPNNQDYKYYGERGIDVCLEWRNSFETFVEDMGTRPGPEYSIDRVDNHKGYSKANCRWATKLEQMTNTRHNTRVRIDGMSLTVRELADYLGLNYSTVRSRVQKGVYDVEYQSPSNRKRDE